MNTAEGGQDPWVEPRHFSDKKLAIECISKQINKNNSYTPWQSACGGNENIYPQIITHPAVWLPCIEDKIIQNSDCMFRVD